MIGTNGVELVIAVLMACITLLKALDKYLKHQASQHADEPPPESAAEEDDTADTEEFVKLLRDGPRAMDAKARDSWQREQRERGVSEADIQTMLDMRDPIVRL